MGREAIEKHFAEVFQKVRYLNISTLVIRVLLTS
jgi:hypothetical protein